MSPHALKERARVTVTASRSHFTLGWVLFASTMGLPMGLGFNFSINGSPMVIPMAIEEPSVVAAVSSAAKTISSYQGFQAWAPERNMIIAQVQLLDILDSKMDQVVAKMEAQEMDIREEANEYCTNMVLRGGGVQRVTLHRGRCSEWLVVHLHIDVGDAMGANCANTVAEGIAPYLAKLSGGRIGVRILSNLNVDRIAKSTFRLPFSHMGYKSVPGHEVAVRVLEAYEWADLDPYRAATHNKGIMNGIDAVALATGQDWRAVEAGAHAWASDEERLRQGYKGQDALVFCGELEIPIMVGTKGGVLSTNPVHAFALGVMRYPDSKQLAMAMATVGLAQNFAALRALVTEGIQRGHMSLHARNIAISAGTPPASVDEVTAYMIDTGKIRLGAAKSYIEQRGLGLGLAPFYSSSSSGLTSNSTTTNTTSTAATATATTTTTATTTAATLAAVTAPSVITATTTTTTSATSINGTDSSHGPNGTSTDMEMASTSAQVRHNCDEGS
ncbi:hydroxymethylglutaryl-CoA reductase [Mortierella sp. GBAus27b]|nr:hydroxymethylglutaryl-CoA reductase [Mortierella sp. GBAus27b]